MLSLFDGLEPAGVLSADPPWPFKDKMPGNRGAGRKYQAMEISAIKSLPLPPLEDDCYLFLWRVASMVEEAYEVVRAWDFKPKSEVVWAKTTKPAQEIELAGRRSSTVRSLMPKLHFGQGWHCRAAHETCIIATRGRPRPLKKTMRSVFHAPVPRFDSGGVIHSRKPDLFYEQVADCYEGPFVDLFAKVPRDGWRCFGWDLNGWQVAA